jgi:hypothetical protein
MKIKKKYTNLIAPLATLLFGIYFMFLAFRYVYIKNYGIVLTGKVVESTSPSWRQIGYEVDVKYNYGGKDYKTNYFSYFRQTPNQPKSIYILRNKPEESVVNDFFHSFIAPLLIGSLAIFTPLYVLYLGLKKNKKVKV